MLRALGVVVIGFAVINLTSALRLAGVDFTSASAPRMQAVSANVTVTPPTRPSTQSSRAPATPPPTL